MKHFLNNFKWMKIWFSPFIPPKIKFYFGKTAIGTPYFYPRKWVKGTPKLIHEAVLKHVQREENYNKLNPKYARKIKSYDELYEEKKNYLYAVPRKIGFDFVDLGWKTKWEKTDYRFEYSPIWSFVFFGYQFAVLFVSEHNDELWTAWLYYERNTNQTKNVSDRIEECRNNFSLTYTWYKNGTEETIDYYNLVLKEKYLK